MCGNNQETSEHIFQNNGDAKIIGEVVINEGRSVKVQRGEKMVDLCTQRIIHGYSWYCSVLMV